MRPTLIQSIFLAGSMATAALGAAHAALPNGVAVGDLESSAAVLLARTDTPGIVEFTYGFATAGNPVIGSVQAQVIDPLIPAKVEIDGLLGGTPYWVRATDAAGATAEGRFRTPHAFGQPARLRFGVTGDWRGELAPYPAIANMAERDLDVIIKLGDTIYADYPSPDLPVPQALTLQDFRIKNNEVYSERYGRNFWAEARGAAAVLATIDDHEVTNDFAGGADPATDDRFEDGVPYINETELYANGLQAFHDYNPIREEFYGATGDPRTAEKRRLYRERTYSNLAAFFLLDARSFRDEELPGVENPLDPQQVGAFLLASFDPTRTMLAAAQIADLQAGLLAAQAEGVTWKFIFVPEPIQNLGVVGAPDRFEGYAAERTALLEFIVDNSIENVVWVAADIHGTLVNNLTYQLSPFGPQIPTAMWEITTGAAAFDAPFGPTVALLALQYGLLTEQEYQTYLTLPRSVRDQFIAQLVDLLVTSQGYDPLGLTGSPVSAELLEGTYNPTHTFGWTEFEIDAVTRRLEVVTYGIDPYTQAEMEADPDAILARTPEVVSHFRVLPEAATTIAGAEPAERFDFRLLANSAEGIRLGLEIPEAGRVRVGIHSLDGRSIATLHEGHLTSGSHTIHWDWRGRSGEGLPSGVYFARAEVDGVVRSEKIVRLD